MQTSLRRIKTLRRSFPPRIDSRGPRGARKRPPGARDAEEPPRTPEFDDDDDDDDADEGGGQEWQPGCATAVAYLGVIGRPKTALKGAKGGPRGAASMCEGPQEGSRGPQEGPKRPWEGPRGGPQEGPPGCATAVAHLRVGSAGPTRGLIGGAKGLPETTPLGAQECPKVAARLCNGRCISLGWAGGRTGTRQGPAIGPRGGGGRQDVQLPLHISRFGGEARREGPQEVWIIIILLVPSSLSALSSQSSLFAASSLTFLTPSHHPHRPRIPHVPPSLPLPPSPPSRSSQSGVFLIRFQYIAFLFPAPPEGRGQAGHAEKEK